MTNLTIWLCQYNGARLLEHLVPSKILCSYDDKITLIENIYVPYVQIVFLGIIRSQYVSIFSVFIQSVFQG